MSENELSGENELKYLAVDLGLERLAEAEPETFARTLQKTRDYASRRKPPKAMTDEPAHIFHAGIED